MKIRLIFFIYFFVTVALLHSCKSNSKKNETEAIVSKLSNRFNCELKSEVAYRSDSSFITIYADCQSLNLHEYGKILVEVYEELNANGLHFDHYLIRSMNHKRQLGFVAEAFPAIIKKRAGFYKAAKLLENGDFKSFVDIMHTNIKPEADSITVELFQNNYHFTGKIEFTGFEITVLNTETIGYLEPNLKVVTFIGKTVKNEQVSISMNTSEDDNKIYGIHF